MRSLSYRLQVIFDLINDGAKVADIGTDHAYLPIALSLSKKCKSIIACDIKEKPLSKARENIKKFGITDIDTRLSNGLMEISFGEADTVVIAGMGGDVISKILSDCNWIKDSKITLLLQPMTSAEILRKYLLDNRFSILEETPLTEQGKVYSVIKACFTGEKTPYSDGFLYIGKVKANTPDGRAYIEKQLNRINAVIADLESLDGKENDTLKYKEIKKYIDLSLEIC